MRQELRCEKDDPIPGIPMGRSNGQLVCKLTCLRRHEKPGFNFENDTFYRLLSDH